MSSVTRPNLQNTSVLLLPALLSPLFASLNRTVDLFRAMWSSLTAWWQPKLRLTCLAVLFRAQVNFVPISGFQGDNMIERSTNLSW